MTDPNDLAALRAEVAAARGIPAAHAHRLTGTTRTELDADAAEFVADMTGAPGPDAFMRNMRSNDTHHLAPPAPQPSAEPSGPQSVQGRPVEHMPAVPLAGTHGRRVPLHIDGSVWQADMNRWMREQRDR